MHSRGGLENGYKCLIIELIISGGIDGRYLAIPSTGNEFPSREDGGRSWSFSRSSLV